MELPEGHQRAGFGAVPRSQRLREHDLKPLANKEINVETSWYCIIPPGCVNESVPTPCVQIKHLRFHLMGL